MAHLAHGMLSQTGFRLMNAPTFMPAYIMLLSGGSNLAVGLSSALQSFGMTLTPMIGANLIEHRKRVLPVAFSTGWGMRGMILAISLSGLILPTPWSLWALMLFLAGFGLFQGMQGVIFNFLMAKVIPVSKRGRLTGMRNFLAGIISALVAWLSGQYLIGDTPTAAGYSYTFLLVVRADQHRSFGARRGARAGTADGAPEGEFAHAPGTSAVAASRRPRIYPLLPCARARNDGSHGDAVLHPARRTYAGVVRRHAGHPHVCVHAVGNVLESRVGTARRP